MSGAPSPDCPSACARARRPTGSGRCSSAIIGWGPSTCGIPSWPNTPCAPSTNLKLIPTFLPPPKRSPSVTHVSEHLLPLSPVQTRDNAFHLHSRTARPAVAPYLGAEKSRDGGRGLKGKRRVGAPPYHAGSALGVERDADDG